MPDDLLVRQPEMAQILAASGVFCIFMSTTLPSTLVYISFCDFTSLCVRAELLGSVNENAAHGTRETFPPT